MRRVLTCAVLAAVLLAAGTPADAAVSTYSAPLRTAVRQLSVASESNGGMNRDVHFGQWIDADRDCHNTRQEVLIAEGTGVGFSSRGCIVNRGRWQSFYDGKVYTDPAQPQIDHFIPVAEAWGSGARTWTQARRVAFYNDLSVGYALNAMPNALNQSKQASGPEQWMPPVNRCRYIEIWASMKHRWRLTVDPAEQASLTRYADGCPNRTLTVPYA